MAPIIEISNSNGLVRAPRNALVRVVSETEHDGGQVASEEVLGILEKRGGKRFTIITPMLVGEGDKLKGELGRAYYVISPDGSKISPDSVYPLDRSDSLYEGYERRLAEAGLVGKA